MERPHLKRRLTAVLLADVVGYSRLMSADEDGTHIRLANCVKNLIEPTVALHEGRLVRSKGDGFLVEFDSAVNAVSCAVDIQRGLAALDDGSAGDRKLQLRIGINSGDVIVDQNDIYGNSVNIAARLEGLAEPGGIYVTRTVCEQLLGRPGLFFEDVGDRRVKNIGHPIRVYRVTSNPAAGSGNASDTLKKFVRLFAGRIFRRSRTVVLGLCAVALAAITWIGKPPAWHQSAVLPARASIMVLPFRNLSGPDQDYFADAVTDILTTDLSRLADTMVIARATAFTYKGKSADAREIRREFGVRYILAGSIQRIGLRVQANAELIDTSSTTSLWAERFKSELTDPFELQEAVTGRIATSLHLQLVRAENRRTSAERPTDLNAYDLRLRAMAYLIDKVTPENTLAARLALEKSVARDPDSAEVWGELANVLMIDFFRDWNDATEENIPHAEDAVQKAYAIDPSLALAHLAEARIRRAKGDHQGALEACDEALRLDRNLTEALVQKAFVLVFLGRANEAPPLVETAMTLSPRDPDPGNFHWALGRAYFSVATAPGTPPEAAGKHYDDAIHWLQKSVQESPGRWYVRAHLISAYALAGRLGEREAKAALTEYRKKFENWPLDPNIRNWTDQERFRDAHPDYQATIHELLRGLQIAQAEGFP
jgi:adenylate cyclase